eukprot:3375298-Rhodomonas_salina.1
MQITLNQPVGARNNVDTDVCSTACPTPHMITWDRARAQYRRRFTVADTGLAVAVRALLYLVENPGYEYGDGP